MNSRIIPWVTIFVIYTFTCFSCSSDGSSLSVSSDADNAFQDTLAKWEEYLETSAEGPWERQPEHSVSVERLASFGGEEEATPPFFHPIFVDIAGDTIIVSDRANETVIAIDTTGNVLWEYGGLGEGPGYLMGVGSVSISDSMIAVINTAQSYIDIITRSGEFFTRLSAVQNPQTALFLDDGTLVAFSKRHPGGDAHIVNIELDSVVTSFGSGNWEPENQRDTSRFDIWAAEFPPNHLAYVSQFEPKLIICDLTDYSSNLVYLRNLPYRITPPDISIEGNSMFGTFYPVMGSIYPGPEGEICIGLHTIKRDGTMIGSGTEEENRAPVTPVDRYNLAGEYLDTFIVPDSIISRTACEGDLYVSVQGMTGQVQLYRMRLSSE